jgi:hypothetical protein
MAQQIGNAATPNLVISLSLPRTRSVALLQSVAAAGSFSVCLHEPTIRPYDIVHYPEIAREWFIDGFENFDSIITFIREKLGEGQAIFIKDMVFSASEWLLENRLTFLPAIILLWLRHPYPQLFSLVAKAQPLYPVNPVIGNICDYRELRNVYVSLKSTHRVYLCNMDVLLSNPVAYLEKLRRLLGLSTPFGKTNWNPITSEQARAQWKESKKQDQFMFWHGDAANSTGFNPPKNTTFDDTSFDFVSPEYREYIRNLYTANKQIYGELLPLCI